MQRAPERLAGLRIPILAIFLLLTLTGCAPRSLPVQSPAGVTATVPPATESDDARVPPAEEPEFEAETTAPDPGEEISASPLDALAQVTPEIDAETLIAERALVETTQPDFDIPMVSNDKVLYWINYYTRAHKRNFLPGLERSGRYLPLFRRIFEEEGVPQDLVYMAHVESAYKTSAYSRAKAMGIWQFIAGTARMYDLKMDYWVDERRDPEKSARAAARYLKKLYGDFGDWYLAMAAYNGGEGRIGRALARSGKTDFWGIAETKHIRRETINYVPAILAAIQISKDPDKFGMGFQPDAAIEYDTVQIDGAVDLQVLADCAGSDYEALRSLNPALRRHQTPPNSTTQVRVPLGSGDRTLAALAEVPEAKRVLYVRHAVRRGDTLSRLAGAYGVTVSAIQAANDMGQRTMISVGKELVIPTVAAGKFAATTTATRASAPAQRSSGETIVYRVRRGDTLSAIARRYDTTARAIAANSGISVHKVLQIGQRLRIVSGAQSSSDVAEVVADVADVAARAERQATYTVRRGDTLWRIANLFRISVDQLCLLNGISKHGTLYPGTRLTVGP